VLIASSTMRMDQPLRISNFYMVRTMFMLRGTEQRGRREPHTPLPWPPAPLNSLPGPSGLAIGFYVCFPSQSIVRLPPGGKPRTAFRSRCGLAGIHRPHTIGAGARYLARARRAFMGSAVAPRGIHLRG
jgi:hypothetical protein